MAAPVHALTTKAAEVLERAAFLDPVGSALGGAVRAAIPDGPVKDVVSGTWLGHALHPLLTDAVIGTWASALLLDLLGGEDAEGGADLLLLAGAVAYGPTALTGASDYGDSLADAGAQRVGVIHAAVNWTAMGLQVASLVARRSGERDRGRALSLAAAGALGVGGWLGGHMSYKQGVGVDQTTFDPGPEEWTVAAASAELEEGALVGVDVEGTPVLLVRHAGQVAAMHDRCSHRGCALSSDGELAGEEVVCACHGSRFGLRDGRVHRGPAVYDQPAYEVRERGGRVELRLPAR